MWTCLESCCYSISRECLCEIMYCFWTLLYHKVWEHLLLPTEGFICYQMAVHISIFFYFNLHEQFSILQFLSCSVASFGRSSKGSNQFWYVVTYWPNPLRASSYKNSKLSILDILLCNFKDNSPSLLLDIIYFWQILLLEIMTGSSMQDNLFQSSFVTNFLKC